MAQGRFSGARQKHAARVLATAGPKSLFELLDLVGGERRALERSLESLEKQGLTQVVSTGNAPAPGQPSRLWSLTSAGRNALLDRSERVGQLREGLLWVRAIFSAEDAIAIDDVLSDGELVAPAAWITRLDGDGRSYLFAFDPAMGLQPAESLFRALSATGAQCSMGSIRAPQTGADFVETIRTAARAAERASHRR